MTHLLTLLSWVPIGAAGAAGDWYRVGAKACRSVCWCMWKCRRGRQGTYEGECTRKELRSRQGGPRGAAVWHSEPCWLNSVSKVILFQFDHLFVYICALPLHLWSFHVKAVALQIKHWAGASFPKSNGNFKNVMILRLSLELYRTFLPLISKTD